MNKQKTHTCRLETDEKYPFLMAAACCALYNLSENKGERFADMETDGTRWTYLNILRRPNEDHCEMLQLYRNTETEICCVPSIAQRLRLQ